VERGREGGKGERKGRGRRGEGKMEGKGRKGKGG